MNPYTYTKSNIFEEIFKLFNFLFYTDQNLILKLNFQTQSSLQLQNQEPRLMHVFSIILRVTIFHTDILH